jgi:hypothetical protein
MSSPFSTRRSTVLATRVATTTIRRTGGSPRAVAALIGEHISQYEKYVVSLAAGHDPRKMFVISRVTVT